MNKTQAISGSIRRSREMGHEYDTEEAYARWIGRFCDYMNCHADGSPERFLNGLATGLMGRDPVAQSTQRQALNALNHLYKEVLGSSLGELNIRFSEKPPRARVCLSHGECHDLFGQMLGVSQLLAQLMYGTGARITEAVSIRIKDLDFAGGMVTIRGGKGDKDRSVPMPKLLRDQLAEQIEKARHWWEVDQRAGNPPPYLPPSLAKKLGKQVGELPWFWLFPSTKLSADKRSGIVRRHHLSEEGIRSAMKKAVAKTKIMKRVTPHVMRHSYATESLRNGLDLKTLSIRMGHESIETTEIYLHSMSDLPGTVGSPLDEGGGDPGKVVAFVGGEVQAGPLNIYQG